MLSIQSSSARIGDRVEVEVRQTDGAGGVEFTLSYDSSALTFLEWIAAPDTNPTLPVDPIPGAYRYVVQNIEGLPELLGRFAFQVNGQSVLEFQDVVMGTTLGENIDPVIQNGEITIEETEMNFEAFWDAIPASYGVTAVRVFVGDSVDPTDGTFSQVAEVAAPATVAPFSLGANIGTKFAYGVAVDAEGDVGPAHTPVAFSTDLALPALVGFGVRIV